MHTDTVTYCRCLLITDMFDKSKIILINEYIISLNDITFAIIENYMHESKEEEN